MTNIRNTRCDSMDITRMIRSIEYGIKVAEDGVGSQDEKRTIENSIYAAESMLTCAKENRKFQGIVTLLGVVGASAFAGAALVGASLGTSLLAAIPYAGLGWLGGHELSHTQKSITDINNTIKNLKTSIADFISYQPE